MFTACRMLAIHQRAASIPDNPGIPWYHFIRSQFVGPSPDRNASLAISIHALTQQSETHADLRGVIEYSAGSSLPVVFEFHGSLLLDTREISVEEQQLNQPARSYTGQFSENGRVIALRLHSVGRKASSEFHLIHKDTLAHFSGDTR